MNAETLQNPSYQDNSVKFGIYIHWPFCLSKCPYCDFFSQIKKDVEQETIIKEYLEDLDFYAEKTGDRVVESIFFGGGTPSLIKPNLIEKIINHIQQKWKCKKDIEISLEANPNNDRKNLFKDLRQAGINRLSLGVQALNDKDLKFLGRTHNLEQAYTAIDEVLQNFDNHSFDLIYARPKQTLSAWQEEIKQAVHFGFKHLSMYQLTIEEGTVFYKKQVEAAEEDIAREMYLFTNQYLQENGYLQYEVSNYAQSGFPSRHNLLYWQGDDYLGIGKSAHGRLKIGNRFYALTHRRQEEEISASERAEELIIMGLRLNEGISKEKFYNVCGIKLADFINQKNLSELKAEKLIEETKTHMLATNEGRLVLNKLIEDLCS